MDFSLALALLRQGHSIRRDGWHGKDQNLHLQEPDALSKMTLRYIYLEFPAGFDSRGRVPWVATQTDLLAYDWVIVERTPAKAPQAAQERVKPARKGKGSPKARKPLVRDPEAPYGRKLDGTPRAAPGRKKVVTQ
jgi:hypothetical protein